jgi:anaerobic ribonucleoside-triphosphate reductase
MNEKKCEVELFSRVTGFFRPVQSWNKGKAAEFEDRREYDIAEVSEKACMASN